MGIIDFFFQYLALVLASITSTVIITMLGWLAIKRMVNKAMQSREVQDFKKGFESLKKELEELKKAFQAKGSYVV